MGGLHLDHPDVYSMIMQDAHHLARSEIYVYDRWRHALHGHAANGRGGSLALPADLLDSHCAFHARGYRLDYDFRRLPYHG